MKDSKKLFFICIAVLLIAASFGSCAKVNYVINDGAIKAAKEIADGSWTTTAAEENGADADENVVGEFKAGTYGGVELKTQNDAIDYFKKAYELTKTKTVKYTDKSGKETECYELLGENELQVGAILIEGQENSIIKKIAPGIVSSIFTNSVCALPPSKAIQPENDNNSGDESKAAECDFTKSLISADDILACSVKDNGDGTITISLQPKETKNSVIGNDASGKFFDVLGDVPSIVDQIGIMSFTQGDVNDNIILTYKGGTGIITIDTKTNLITAADYNMKVQVDVTHVSAAGIVKDKSAAVSIEYNTHFPAEAKYIKEYAGLTKK